MQYDGGGEADCASCLPERGATSVPLGRCESDFGEGRDIHREQVVDASVIEWLHRNVSKLT